MAPSQHLNQYWVQYWGMTYGIYTRQGPLDLLKTAITKMCSHIAFRHCTHCTPSSTWAPFTDKSLTLIPARISIHITSIVWDEITYPFPNSNGCTVEVFVKISNFISHFMMDAITLPCWDYSYFMLVKRVPGVQKVKTFLFVMPRNGRN